MKPLTTVILAGLAFMCVAADLPPTPPAAPVRIHQAEDGDEHADPATQPADPAGLRAAERVSAELRTRNLPTVKKVPLADALHFEIENNNLTIRTTLPATPGLSRIDLAELPNITTINIQDARDRNPKSRRLFYQMMNYDFSRNDAIQVITTVFQGPGNLQIAQDSDLLNEERTVQLVQQPLISDSPPGEGEEPVRLFIKVTDKTSGEEKLDLRLTATSFVDLRRKYPREAVQFLQPIFRDLKQEAGAFTIDTRAAWQVLADRSPQTDPQLGARIDELVKKFDADGFQDRQNAQDELKKLGQPAALILLAKDRTSLTIQQNSEIDAFLAAYQPLDKQQVQTLRNDPNFLIDALYSDDAVLRAAALSKLKDSTNEKFEFDVNAPAETRFPAIEALRSKFVPALVIPTTSPTNQ